MAAPPMCPVSSARARASISTTLPRTHRLHRIGVDDVASDRRLGHVQAHNVSLGEELVEAIDRGGIPKRELVLDVVVQDAHPEPLGEDPELASDTAVSDDA